MHSMPQTCIFIYFLLDLRKCLGFHSDGVLRSSTSIARVYRAKYANTYRVHISLTFQIDNIGLLFRFIFLKLAYYLLTRAAAVVFSHNEKNYWSLVETMLLSISLCSRFATQYFVWNIV